MARVGGDVQPSQLVQSFQDGFGALWLRAHQTLGDVTLTAIFDRVLHYAVERFPIMSSVRVETKGLRCDELREKAAAGVPLADLRPAIHFVLVEFLTVLGNLTADILTPSLHAALCEAAGRQGIDQRQSQAKRPELALKTGEDAKR